MKIALLTPNAKLPIRSTHGAGGFDLFSSEQATVPAASAKAGRVRIGRALVSTGIAVAIPRGHVGKIGSRSGLSTGYNIEVGAGWIDSDYRGEIKVEIKNFGPARFTVQKHMRIAQLFVLRLYDAKISLVKRLPRSVRGSRGFGSTGFK